MAKILVTGGCGFIGSNFIRYWLKNHPNDAITNIDLLTYAASKKTLDDLKSPKHIFVKADICNKNVVENLMKNKDAVFHFAAETHVDRSILNSQVFLKTNILGTHTLLEAARENKVKRFIFVSTDEVYGSLKKGSFRESSPMLPNSPYASSKASADLLCRSYHETYGMPVITTRCCNNFGPFHFPEKVIPLFVTNLLEGKKIPIYAKGLNVREWIYVTDHCRAIDMAYRRGKAGEVYNVGTGDEIRNIDLAKLILGDFGKSAGEIQFVKDRPGHDFRYSLDSSKIRKLGFKPLYEFKNAIRETIAWYEANRGWWMPIKKRAEYKTYCVKQYVKR